MGGLCSLVCWRGHGRGRILRSSRRYGCFGKGLRGSWYGLCRWRRRRWGRVLSLQGRIDAFSFYVQLPPATFNPILSFYLLLYFYWISKSWFLLHCLDYAPRRTRQDNIPYFALTFFHFVHSPKMDADT